MKLTSLLLTSILTILMVGCSKKEGKFPIEKRYWDVNDYQNIVRELRFGFKQDETLPNFKDPESAIIPTKLIDQNNFKVILEDKELGLNHKSKIGEDFFSVWQDMMNIYNATNRKDQYLYEKERLSVWHFGLGLQRDYFELGNERIKQKADDPNADNITSLINRNVGTLISNYNLYLDEINNEVSYTNEGLQLLAEGISKYFNKVVFDYPNSSFNSTRKKAELLSKKTKSNNIKIALEELIKNIDARKK